MVSVSSKRMQTGFSNSAAVSTAGFSIGGGPAFSTAAELLSCLDTCTLVSYLLARSLLLVTKTPQADMHSMQEQHGHRVIKLTHLLKQRMPVQACFGFRASQPKVYHWAGATLCSKPAAIALTLIPICDPIDSSGVKVLLP